MKRAFLRIRAPLTMAIAALSVTAVTASSRRPAAAVSSPIPDRDHTNAVIRDAHGDRDRRIVVFESFSDPLWDPFWGWSWYAPYAYPYSYPPPYSPSSVYAREIHRGLVPIELHVHPWRASVIVDRDIFGQARDYNDETHPLWLTPGKHVAELQYLGYETLRFELDIEKGLPRDLHYRLTKGEGMDPRSQLVETHGGGSDQRPGSS
jgi:hypothetical protein